MKLAFSNANCPTDFGTHVIFTTQGAGISAIPNNVVNKSNLSAAAKTEGFTNKNGQSMTLYSGGKKILLIGLGKNKSMNRLATEKLGNTVWAKIKSEKDVHIHIPPMGKDNKATDQFAADLAAGIELKAYAYTEHKSKKSSGTPNITFYTKTGADAAYARKAKPLVDGVNLARDLTNGPGNKLYPDAYAKKIQQEFLGSDVSVEVLDEKEMEALGMGSLLSVGQGSVQPPRLVVMRYNGNPGAKDQRPVVFVGKGVTFDTGGISLKPGGGMHEMKYDKGGAGATVGAMKALSGRKAKANIVAIVGLAENMPSGNATRPGDIVTSMSGKTIEVNNTDAEGRLVLADAMTYAQRKLDQKPKLIVDLATLTGAIITALGHDQAGLFSNNKRLVNQFNKAADTTGEAVWHMPITDTNRNVMKGQDADLNNLGGGGAGSATAAAFLENFVEGKTPWVHLDIAGTAWGFKGPVIATRGATGFGVRLLDQFVADNYEAKPIAKAAKQRAFKR